MADGVFVCMWSAFEAITERVLWCFKSQSHLDSVNTLSALRTTRIRIARKKIESTNDKYGKCLPARKIIYFLCHVNKLDWDVPENFETFIPKIDRSTQFQWIGIHLKAKISLFIVTKMVRKKCTKNAISLQNSLFNIWSLNSVKRIWEWTKCYRYFLLAQLLSNGMTCTDIYSEISLWNDISRMKYRVTPKAWLKWGFFRRNGYKFFLRNAHNVEAKTM